MTSAILQRHADLLPPGARELADLIGLPATLRLVAARRGRVIEVAKGKRTRGKVQLQELAEIVGKIAADKIARHYGGAPLVVPKCYRALQAARDVALQARFDELTKVAGLSARRAVAQLVPEFDLVESSVWRALKRSTGDADVAARVVEEKQLGLAF